MKSQYESHHQTVITQIKPIERNEEKVQLRIYIINEHSTD